MEPHQTDDPQAGQPVQQAGFVRKDSFGGKVRNIIASSKYFTGLSVVLLTVGLVGGVYLSQQNSDNQQHAASSAPVCINYMQSSGCKSGPDGPTSGKDYSFVMAKCGTSSFTYKCFDPTKGSYYTQRGGCATSPLGPVSSTDHVYLVRKLIVSGKTTFSCVADCTANPSIAHCPAATTPSPTPDTTASGSASETPTSSDSATPSEGTSPSDTPAAPLVGDINGDGVVDILDYNSLITCYGVLVSSPTDACPNPKASDLDGNGTVDGVDYNILLRAMAGE